MVKMRRVEILRSHLEEAKFLLVSTAALHRLQPSVDAFDRPIPAAGPSVIYIFCNEEPLWMNLCLNNENRELQYKGSWKKTTLDRISQRSAKKLSMKFEDYVSYMQVQHDEDPLYIFDDKFGEVAPNSLKDYNVPHLFLDDYFDVLDDDQRLPFRWLIIRPERSGASWHVDLALTSAWNTLLCGRKR
ncbi:hypothetical protein L2E82_31008 [Cichorium intybus]|uniref:Uncharacterized protein n=1 Tax=Cichorium intybus TaxID=13427 RepID=A0ACB9D271_CICIN|nr:hypothetical protein L2E82_31008 [Cichorium intybus]